jgi:hypothetical protein
MRLAIALGALALTATVASAQMYGTGSNSSSHYVSPYTNSHGTTTQGHYQTNSNNTQRDNYSATGNVNPYTGAVGTRTPRY